MKFQAATKKTTETTHSKCNDLTIEWTREHRVAVRVDVAAAAVAAAVAADRCGGRATRSWAERASKRDQPPLYGPTMANPYAISR